MRRLVYCFPSHRFLIGLKEAEHMTEDHGATESCCKHRDIRSSLFDPFHISGIFALVPPSAIRVLRAQQPVSASIDDIDIGRDSISHQLPKAEGRILSLRRIARNEGFITPGSRRFLSLGHCSSIESDQITMG